MARRAEAQIVIQLRGGLKAAREARTAADGFDALGDEISDTSRQAAGATVALSLLERELQKVARAQAYAAITAKLHSAAVVLLAGAMLGLAITAGPAMVAAITASAVAVVAFGAALGGIGLAVGVLAAGAVMRFQEMSGAADSAAGRMKAAALGLKDTFGSATAGGADAIFEGLIPLLTGVSGLVKDLTPDFTAVGEAIGKSLGWLGESIGELRPELSALLQATTGAFQPLAQIALTLFSLFARVATEAMPYVIQALDGLQGLLLKAQGAVTNGAIATAFDTLFAVFGGIMSFIGGISAALGPTLVPAAQAMATAFDGMSRPLGLLVGTIMAGLVQLGQGVLPGILQAVRDITPALKDVVDSGALQQIGSALGTTFSIAAKVIGFVVGGLARLGLLGPGLIAITGAVLAFKLGVIALNIAMSMNPVVAIALGIAALAAGLVYAYHHVEGFRNAVDTAWGVIKSVGGWIKDNWPVVVGVLGGPLGVAAGLVIRHFGTIKGAATSVVNSVRDRFSSLISFFTGLPGKFASAAGSIGKAIASGIAGGIKSAGGLILDALKAAIPGPVRSLIGKAGGALGGLASMFDGAATGGTMLQGGLIRVGERGEELVSLPTGATVYPNHHPLTAAIRQPLRASAGGGKVPPIAEGSLRDSMPALFATTIVKVEEREIGRSVDRYRLRAAEAR